MTEDPTLKLSDLELLKLAADRLRELAFEMPAPNAHTPRLLELAGAMEREFYLRSAAHQSADDDVAPIYLSAEERSALQRQRNRRMSKVMDILARRPDPADIP